MGEMTIHIEPCPFCGASEFGSNRHASEFVHVEPRSPDGALSVSMNYTGYFWVECCNCYAKGPHYGGVGRKQLNKGPAGIGRDKAKTAEAIVRAIEAWNLHERPQPTLWEVDE